MAWRDHLPAVRGRLALNEPLAPFTWLRVGGPADVLFLPEDAEDLANFLKGLDPNVPVMAIGVGSNLLVRDGGVDGVVIRLGKGFARIEPRPDHQIYAGAGALDASLAKAAAQAGLAGLEFFCGVPGAIGGACMMNAGCYGAETKDVLVQAYALTRAGEAVTLSNQEMGFSYRRSAAAAGGELIFTGALFQGTPDTPQAVTERMNAITQRREQTQPIREKAGWRGKPFGGAMFSPLHANFLINTGSARAADLEGLGEAVRAQVLAQSGISLDWEIKRIGRPGLPS
jgi:UDP-N-acetylmuramate dehydrogenase